MGTGKRNENVRSPPQMRRFVQHLVCFRFIRGYNFTRHQHPAISAIDQTEWHRAHEKIDGKLESVSRRLRLQVERVDGWPHSAVFAPRSSRYWLAVQLQRRMEAMTGERQAPHRRLNIQCEQCILVAWAGCERAIPPEMVRKQIAWCRSLIASRVHRDLRLDSRTWAR